MANKVDPEELILPEPSHVGYATVDIERSIGNFKKYWGIESFVKMVPEYFNRKYYGEPGDFRMQFAFARVGNMVYELIQVLEGKTLYGDFIKDHGEGIHHLGYEVSDLDKWIEAYKRTGREPIMSAERVGLKIVYFDTPEITVELLERAPEGKVV